MDDRVLDPAALDVDRLGDAEEPPERWVSGRTATGLVERDASTWIMFVSAGQASERCLAGSHKVQRGWKRR